MIIKSKFIRPFTGVLVILTLLLFPIFIGCSVVQGNDYDVNAAYQAAVDDAAVAEPDEISRNLTAIVPWEPGLVWQGTPGESRVLVVTWSSSSYYDNDVGNDSYWLPEGANIWVTAAPQFKDFFKHEYLQWVEFPTLRAEQLLGLPPDNGKTKFIEIWVDPTDLFRPSPDPEITDHEAGLTFPYQNSVFLAFDTSQLIKDWFGGVEGVYTFEEWFEALKASSYVGDAPYPWTRLGYTYDWGGEDEEGLSEFVIRGGTYIGIKSVTPNEDYLQH